MGWSEALQTSSKINPSDKIILKEICEHPGSTVYDIEKRLRLKKQTEKTIYHVTAINSPKKLEKLGLLESSKDSTGQRIKIHYRPTISGLLVFIEEFWNEDNILCWQTLKTYKEFSNPLLKALMEAAPEDCGFIISSKAGDCLDEYPEIPSERIIWYLIKEGYLMFPEQEEKDFEASKKILRVLYEYKEEILPILDKKIIQIKKKFEGYTNKLEDLKCKLSA